MLSIKILGMFEKEEDSESYLGESKFKQKNNIKYFASKHPVSWYLITSVSN